MDADYGNPDGHCSGQPPILIYGYPQHDPVGNLLTKTTEHGNYVYDYDTSSHLITADNPVLADESYTYDDVGNRLTSADVSGSWSYNPNNDLLGYADVEYEYDADGNLAEVRVAGQMVWTCVYDAANRLVHVEDGTGSISADYYYDPFGRRLWKDVGGTKTYFFYSEEGLIAEYDATGTEIKSYGYKPDSAWTTDPLFQKVGSTYYWYQNDHLGTPQKLVDSTGTVVWSAQYTAFGEADIQVETVTNNLRMPGQYEDAETGLLYNYHRYYDPRIGRYVSADPIGFIGGDINLYGYAWNNPLHFLDIKGLQQENEIGLPGEGLPGHLPPEWLKRTWDILPMEVKLDLIVNFPSDIPRSLWPDLVEGFYERNKKMLTDELKKMCPSIPCTSDNNGNLQGVILNPAILPLPPTMTTCQTCCQENCERQAEIMAGDYMDWIREQQNDILDRYGNILSGDPGNARRRWDDLGFWGALLGGHGLIWDDEEDFIGLGNLCRDWAEDGGNVLFLSLSRDMVEGTLCFRGSWVENLSWVGVQGYNWLLIYAPSKTDGFDLASGNDVLEVDPWPTAGFEVLSSPGKKVDQINMKYWW